MIRFHVRKAWVPWLLLVGPAEILDGLISTLSFGFLGTSFGLEISKQCAISRMLKRSGETRKEWRQRRKGIDMGVIQ